MATKPWIKPAVKKLAPSPELAVHLRLKAISASPQSQRRLHKLADAIDAIATAQNRSAV